MFHLVQHPPPTQIEQHFRVGDDQRLERRGHAIQVGDVQLTLRAGGGFDREFCGVVTRNWDEFPAEEDRDQGRLQQQIHGRVGGGKEEDDDAGFVQRIVLQPCE